MKTKILFIFIITLFVNSWGLSQGKGGLSKPGSMQVFQTSFNKFQFYISGNKVLSEDIEDIIKKESAEAYAYFKKAEKRSALANLSLFVGGVAIGFPVGILVGGGEPKWALAIAGVGFLIVGIPLQRSAYKNYKKAVRLYNQNLSLDVSLLTEEICDEVIGNVHY